MAQEVVGRLRTDLVLNSRQYVHGMRLAGYATREFKGKIESASKAINHFAHWMHSGVGMLSIGAVYSFTQVTRAVEEFNQAMASSTAIMGDLSDRMRTDLVQAAHDVAFATKFNARETAGAYYEIASAGLSAEQAIKALPVVATFAQAGMMDLKQAAQLLTTSQGAMGLASEDATKHMKNMTRIANVLVKVNNLAEGSLQDFATALRNDAAGALRITNKSLEEGVAILAAFAKKGVMGAEAGTGLAIVLRDLQAKSIKNPEAFKKAGISVFDNGEMRKTWEILRDIEVKLKGLTTEGGKKLLMDLGFMEKSVRYIQTLIGSADVMENVFNQLTNVQGVMQEVADKQLPSLSKGWGELKDVMFEAATAQSGIMADLGRGMSWYAKNVKEATDAYQDRKRVISKLKAFQIERPGWYQKVEKQYPSRAFVVGTRILRLRQLEAMDREAEAKYNATIGNDGAAAVGGGAGIVGEMNPLIGNLLQKAVGMAAFKLTELRANIQGVAGRAFRGAVGMGAEMLFDKKADKKNAADASSIFGESLSDYEQMIKKMGDIKRLLDVGAISPELFKRTSAQYRKEFTETLTKAPTEMQFAGGAAKGSAEAYSAIVRAMGQDRAKTVALDMQRQQLAEAKKAARSLTVIEQGLKGGEAVNLDNL